MFLFDYNYRNHNNKNVQLFSYYNTLLMRWYTPLICLNGVLATDESKFPIILVYALLYCISVTSKTLHTEKKYGGPESHQSCLQNMKSKPIQYLIYKKKEEYLPMPELKATRKEYTKRNS